MSSVRRLTQEQQSVVQSNARLLAVDAFAGTGKTSTLVEYARARPKARLLYIAFNKSVAVQARERFPDNVECRTTHSLAYGAVGRRFADKLGNASAYDIAQKFNCNARRAKHALATLATWLCSTDPEITLEHVDRAEVEASLEAAAVADLAMGVWAEMQNPRAAIKMPHDGYLKLWAMTQPRLRYDIILLDEAQDTNPITLDLVLAQRQAQLVLVGDRHQGIYGFRKAMNAMQAVQADERIAITQSFRFGQGIAEVATRLLHHFKGEALAVKGRADIEVRWSVDRARPYAIIGRTNAGLFGHAVQLVAGMTKRRIHFVGGFEGYMFGKVLDAYHLWADQRHLIKDATIMKFQSYAQFRSYGDEAGDPEVNALVKVVEAYGAQVPELYAALKAAETSQDNAHVTLTTAHKAKGLEWEQVELCDDFVSLPADEDTDPEEFNLLYVAVTRAIRAVRLTPSLTAWLGMDETKVSEPTTDLGAADAPTAPESRAWASHEVHECWLREHSDLAGAFGDAARVEIEFLLARLDQERSRARL